MRKPHLLQLLLVCLSLFTLPAMAQRITINQGWKLHIGDSTAWSSPQYDDSRWQAADVSKPWEEQGYPRTDGFGWYRLHTVIPSSVREKAYLKDSLHFDLGYLDDGGEVYLNGKLVYENYPSGSDIRHGFYGPGSFSLSASDPAIHWDAQNVIAVRLFDTGGDGGLYGDKFDIRMVDLMDNVSVNTGEGFLFENPLSLKTTVKLVVSGGSYAYSGKLAIGLVDAETGKTVSTNTVDADFAAGKPFSYRFPVNVPKKRSYQLIYTFTDTKSGKDIKKTEGTPYILTPYVKASPRINGPDVFGERPGNPFLYRIPATGQKPLAYKADGLPAGLKLDKGTGIITGVVNEKGDYPVVFTVSNKLGSNSKKFTIKIGDLIGLTPALGWNSWNAWGLSVNDQKVRISARQMADKLSAHGWAYINIDDGWEAPQRNADGTISPNQKFPDMKALTGYVHSLGLRMGIYSSPGPRTCGGYLGSYQHEDQDAQTYGDWGIDYLKYDWCSYGQIAPAQPSLADYQKPYQVMRASLDKVHRDILFSFCQYGMGDVWQWGAQVGGNSWRTTGDIEDTWQSMSGIGFSQDKAAPYAQPGHFNDPDMLVVGKVGWGDSQHNTRLTPDEQYTHISLWSLLSAPLLIGCDMGRLDQFTMNLLDNDEVLAIDQDALGKEARQAIKTDTYQVWVKDLEDGSKAVGIFNTTEQYQEVKLNKADNGWSGYHKYRDVWQQKYVITSGPDLLAKVPPHGVLLLKLSK
ncbi:MAG TPA: putative Ig domain-containing protein [Mucilaginibacter sp.]|nr:putative Ig domain-containing protein [Mucilaginibacter sp.]